MSEVNQYPEGHFLGIWMALGIAICTGIGIPLSIATGNHGMIGIGPAIGVSLGTAIGLSIEKKRKLEGKIRPLTADEKKSQRMLLFLGVAVLVLGVALTATFLLLR